MKCGAGSEVRTIEMWRTIEMRGRRREKPPERAHDLILTRS